MVESENKGKTFFRRARKQEAQELHQFPFVIFFFSLAHKFSAQHNLISNFPPAHGDA